VSKILLINPNKWGRGITHIWIATHSQILKKSGHTVELFDSTFYADWSDHEIEFSTKTQMFQKSDYKKFVSFKKSPIHKDLQRKIDKFKPDIIFWSALSSHIHAEGEYVNIQNGYDLLNNINSYEAIKITGGLQATASPDLVLKNLSKINYLIRGESELVLTEIANKISKEESLLSVEGIAYLKDQKLVENKKQKIINDLDILSPYDYDIFDDETFYRAYNGKVVRAVDFEFSRGCIYSCAYCVETVIQKYYGFEERSNKSGAIKNFKSYLRSKSAKTIYEELEYLSIKKNINFIRCQDTNFLTNDRNILIELSDLFSKKKLNIKLYIETRPEGINEKSIELLKKLNVDGVGMGIELSAETFRENELDRFASQEKTINAFKILKENGIKRTSYNMIGFPNQDEESILETIKFNQLLDPDNITIAFYSPYIGTKQQKIGVDLKVFNQYEFGADAMLRTNTKSSHLTKKKLNYYKDNFVDLVRNVK